MSANRDPECNCPGCQLHAALIPGAGLEPKLQAIREAAVRAASQDPDSFVDGVMTAFLNAGMLSVVQGFTPLVEAFGRSALDTLPIMVAEGRHREAVTLLLAHVLIGKGAEHGCDLLEHMTGSSPEQKGQN